MSTFRLVLKDFSVRRIWSVWTRSFLLSNVVKRCKRDRGVREVFECFKQTLFKPRRTLILSATAAYKSHDDESEDPPGCDQNITDEELKALVSELEGVDELSRTTLFCSKCGKRLVIDKKHPGVRYCACNEAALPPTSHDGWVPYMEADDVIIWRKEYKPGQGLYAYKVYGRYVDVRAEDFAAVQVDSGYRRVWDSAVASLSVVEQSANGVADQAVIHWEVLWPRLFANRDYVYIRRHKEYDVLGTPSVNVGSIPIQKEIAPPPDERPSVHSRAKRKALEKEMLDQQRAVLTDQKDKIFIIVSRSCEHRDVPDTKHAIRVNEYWSHMVVKSIAGSEQIGMEFVLTYYDEPAVGGLPTGVAAWATGRAAPAYLQQMRRAAGEYQRWRSLHNTPEVVTFDQTTEPTSEQTSEAASEQDMETVLQSSNDGPDLEDDTTKDQSTQTEVAQVQSSSSTQVSAPAQTEHIIKIVTVEDSTKETTIVPAKNISTQEKEAKNEPVKPETDEEKPDDDSSTIKNDSGWWRSTEEETDFILWL